MKKIRKINKQTVLTVGKSSAMLVGGIATITLVTLAIKNAVPVENLSRTNKALVTIGSGLVAGIVGGMGAEAAGDIWDTFVTVPLIKIDQAIEAVKEARKQEKLLEPAVTEK